MKTFYKIVLFVAIIGVVATFNFSCSKDEEPYISYVRIPNPAAKDSLLVAAPQMQLIAIIGGNLKNTREVWFNDQQAYLEPHRITNTSIMIEVPNKAPEVVTDQLKLVFKNGKTLTHDFKVTINKPRLDNLYCEYVPEGGKAIIKGGYFYLPISVEFPGGFKVNSADGGISVNADDEKDPFTILTVTVPKGAKNPGPIIVTSNFGITKSGFWFLDDRNIFQDFNDAGWWAGKQVTDPGQNDPPKINGPYYRVTKAIGGWAWTEVFNWWINHLIPDDAIVNPKKYNYKFEVNTLKPYNNNGLRIFVGPRSKGTSDPFFLWNGKTSGIDTKGEWHTVVFPFEDVLGANGFIDPLPEYFFGFLFCGDGTLDCDMCFDNFRVVPKQ